MKKKSPIIFSLVLCVNTFVLAREYQDIVINNLLVFKGATDCITTYQSIRHILNAYKRHFTVLDIGAASGFFSFCIANDYNASCILWEDANKEQLLNLAKLNTKLDNIMVVGRNIEPKAVAALSECEHFDVIVCLNLIDTFKSDWQEAVDTVLTLGNNIIIQITPRKKLDLLTEQCAREIAAYLHKKNGKLIKEPYFFAFEMNKLYLHKSYWNAPVALSPGEHILQSSYEEKYIYNLKKHTRHEWGPGISLQTFGMLDGIWPVGASIKTRPPMFENENPAIQINL